MDLLVLFGIILVLVILNGLFVAAEFAIIGVSRSAVERHAREGNRTAAIVRDILHDPLRQDRYIATAQLGITFASLGLGMYGEHSLANWLAPHLEMLGASQWIAAHTLASILAVTVLTYLHIVIGEMVPKSLALMHADRTVFWITPPMLWIKTALYPLVVALNGIGNGILRLMGIRRQFGAGQYYSPDELRLIVTESQQGGMLQEESGKVLQELFEFGDLTAEEVMVPRVHLVGIAAGADTSAIRDLLRSSPHLRYPVYEGSFDRILGVVHVKDLLRLLIDDAPLHADAVRPVGFVPGTAGLDTLLEVMRQYRTQMVVVMDEHGGTAGLVTIDDLLGEVVGEVETAPGAHPELYHDADGLLHVSGMVRLSEVGEELGLESELEHEQVDTVSGLVLSLLERPPVVGDVVRYEGIGFEVAAVKGHGVAECIVRVPEAPADATDDT
jgi:CBS domain containing-hemolysin-like protein